MSADPCSSPELQRPASQSRLIGEELQPNTRQKASSTHSVDLDSDSDDAIQTQPSKSASRSTRSQNPKQNSKGLIGVQRSATRSQSHDLTGNHRKLNDNEASSRRSGSPTKASARRQGKVRDTTKPTPVAAPLRDIDQYTSASPRRRGLSTSPSKVDAKTIQRDKRGHAVSAATKSHFVDAGESDSDTVPVAASIALSQPTPCTNGATAPANRPAAFHLSTQDSDTSASEASHAASSIRTRPRAKGIARGPSAAVANNAQEAGGHVPRRRSLSSERSGADNATSRSPSVASASTARRRARPVARGPTTGTRAKLSATDTASDSQDARASPGRHRRATSDGDETLPTSTQVIMRNLKRRPLPMVELADIQSQYVPDESVLEGLEEAADGEPDHSQAWTKLITSPGRQDHAARFVMVPYQASLLKASSACIPSCAGSPKCGHGRFLEIRTPYSCLPYRPPLHARGIVKKGKLSQLESRKAIPQKVR